VGNRPYGYIGLGDLAVYVFFGLLGVCGTFYLHTQSLNLDLFLPATATGLLAVAVLNVNNMRDIDNDQACGKTTLAVRMGLTRAKNYHALLVLSAWLCFLGFVLNNNFSLISTILTGVILIPSILHLKSINHAPDSKAIGPLMAEVVKLAIIANLLFSISIIV
jgi:1,4-dihydroxy-2-naphthoate octaprenyltransferase